MEEKILYSMESPFQQEINVKGYYFGKNEGKERSACIVGALREMNISNYIFVFKTD